MANVQVDREKRRLIIDASNPHGLDEGAVLLKLPSRKWMPKLRKFIVPATRMNMKILLDEEKNKRFRFDPPESRGYAQEIANFGSGNRVFPSWYKYKIQPFPDQERALHKIYKNNTGALLMKMGTGKSKVIIDYMTVRFLEREIMAVVLVCPLTVTAVWDGLQGELALHSPVAFEVTLVDPKFSTEKMLKVMSRGDKNPVLHWILVGVESLSQGGTFSKLMPFMREARVGMVVDEASKIKTTGKLRTERTIELGRAAVCKLIATGTLVTKNLMDMFSPYEFLSPNIIGAGDYYAFRNRYAIMGGYKRKEIVGYDHVEELMGLIEPYTYICEKPEGMPAQRWTQRVVQLSDEQKAVYRKIRSATMEGVTVANVLAKMLRLQQVVGGFYSDDPKKEQNPLTGKVRSVPGVEHRIMSRAKNPKIQELVDWLGMLEDRPVIIWAKFRFEVGDLVETLRPLGRLAILTGDTPPPERRKLKEDFQAGKYDFLVGNQAVGGMGLTFTRAHAMVYYSNTDALEDRLQSEDRIHRRGQEDDCLYLDLIAEKTVDVARHAAILAKKDLDVYVRDKIREAGGKTDQLFGDV